MKDGARILGIDEAPFEHSDDSTFLAGVVYRGTKFIEDIRKLKINVDGENASEKVIELHEKCNNTGQIKAVLIDGVSLAGFNVVDLDQISSGIGKPVISTTPNRPDRERFREAMERSGNDDQNFEKLPDQEEVEVEEGTIFLQFSGTDLKGAKEIIENSIKHGLVPEPIRVADMIGSAFRD